MANYIYWRALTSERKHRCLTDNGGKPCQFLLVKEPGYFCTWRPRDEKAAPGAQLIVRHVIFKECPAPLGDRPFLLASCLSGLVLTNESVRHLCAAILLQAVMDYLPRPKSRGGKDNKHNRERKIKIDTDHASAEAYIFGPSVPGDALSFVNICRLLGLNAVKARKMLLAYSATGVRPELGRLNRELNGRVSAARREEEEI
jgi:hypothetical protein